MPPEKKAVLDRLRHQRDAAASVEGAAVCNEWVAALQDLMDLLRGWLAEAEGEGLFRISRLQVPMDEEGLGAYSAPILELQTPQFGSIRIVPRARRVVDAFGRVDFECPPKTTILIRPSIGRWQFAHLVPEKRGWIHEDLTEESFWRVLGELLS